MGCKYIYIGDTYTEDEILSFIENNKEDILKKFNIPYNQNVYVNMEARNTTSVILHEHSHGFLNKLKQSNPEMYQRGLDLANSAEAEEIKEFVRQNQPNLIEGTEAFANEVLAEISGRKAFELLSSKENSNIKTWLNEFFDYIRNLLGLTDYTNEQVAQMSLKEYADAIGIDLLKGEELFKGSKAQEYFTRNADRLPLTLAVFNTQPFQDLQGKQVNPVTVQQLLNKSGIKQIEKELINKVIEDNYRGQKKISYDELEATVRANIMPLERIFTSSYADYGMDNLGNGNYGDARTIILNAPVEHGVTGHFSGDFKARGRKNIKYVPKLLNDNVWVAVEKGYGTQGVNENNIYQYVGTAGTKESVDAWIENYEKPLKTYKKGDLIFKKENEIYTLKDDKGVLYSEIDPEFERVYGQDIELMLYQKLNKSLQEQNAEVNKGMFGHIRVWQDGQVFHVAELQSDYYQKQYVVEDMTQQVINSDKHSFTKENKDRYNSIYKDMLSYRRGYFTLRDEFKEAGVTDKVSLEKLKEKENNYKDKRKQYYNEVVSKAQPLFEKDQKQFIASQKIWEQRLVREAIKEASLSGATSLRFPTPYTLSVIEGYVPAGESSTMPYTVVTGDTNFLRAGDIINYGGSFYTVVTVNDEEIEVVAQDKVKIEKDDSNWNKDLGIQNEEGYDSNGNLIYLYYKQSDAERMTSPNQYYGNTKGALKEDFSIENDLSDTQQTVARKYEEITQILKSERGEENVEIVTDDNGFDWYSTKILAEETQNPVVAFQQIKAPETESVPTLSMERIVEELILTGEVTRSCRM